MVVPGAGPLLTPHQCERYGVHQAAEEACGGLVHGVSGLDWLRRMINLHQRCAVILDFFRSHLR